MYSCCIYHFIVCLYVCIDQYINVTKGAHVFEDSILSFHKHGVVFLQKNSKSINPTSKNHVYVYVYVYVYWEA